MDRTENGAAKRKKESSACGQCNMMVARFAPQVLTSSALYHRECYEAWYFGRYGKRPSLLADAGGERHRWQARERAA